jgi:metal-dependent amidase/aminoacylase/carboxypeptidase family protein
MTIAPELSADLIAEVIATRRDIHANPELGFEETRTASIVAKRLRDLGYEVTEGLAVTGVVGVMRGSRPGKTIMLRADMDALPLSEETGRPFASLTPNAMHACGHDGHVAILLGAARAIAERRHDLTGTIVLCFQPAEEGRGGAKKMVDEGGFTSSRSSRRVFSAFARDRSTRRATRSKFASRVSAGTVRRRTFRSIRSWLRPNSSRPCRRS